MKVYVVCGFSSTPEGIHTDAQVFTTLKAAKCYVNNCADDTIEAIKMDLCENIYYDKVENVFNSAIKQVRTIKLNINLDKDCDKMFLKEHNLASAQLYPQFYKTLDLSDRRLTSITVLDMRIKEVEL